MFMVQRGILIMILFLSCIVHELYAQEQRFFYTHYSSENGLIYEEILDAHLDQDDFIWIASAMGLQRIENYSKKEYYNNPGDSLSISDNIITALFEDRSGNMWIGTATRGLNKYDREQGSFYRYHHSKEDSNTISSNQIPRNKKIFAQDNDGFLWVNTDECLNKIDIQTPSVKRFYGEYKGHILYDEAENALWIADKGLKEVDLTSHNADLVDNTEYATSQFNKISSIIKVSGGDFYLGTDLGLFVFNRKTEKYFSVSDYLSERGFKDTDSYSWAGKMVNALYEDYLGNIWIAIEKTIYILNPGNGEYTTLNHEFENQNSILDEAVTGIYGNKSGVVLVSYIRNGITKIDIKTQKFRYVGIRENSNASNEFNAVRSIFKDKYNNLWIGTFNSGLFILKNQDENNTINYSYDPNDDRSVSANYITALFIDSDERLWAGTFDDGFCFADRIYQSDELTFTRSQFPSNVEVHEFTEDKLGRIWISTNYGFYIHDKATGKTTHYGASALQASEVQQINIQSVHIEPPNVFWLATWNSGLCKLIVNSDIQLTQQASEDTLIIYENLKKPNEENEYRGYITLVRDRKKNFWLGSNVNGLVKMREHNGQLIFTNYDVTSGAPSNAIYGIHEDSNGHLWISSSNGIGKFDPKNELFYNYYASDGLQGNSFVWDAHFQAKDGELYFGGDNGVTAFYPKDISESQRQATAYLSGLFVNHNEVKNGQKVNGAVLLDKLIRFTDEITLSHKESVFALEFGVIGNYRSSEVTFSYILEGYDKKWINTTAENRIATYTNLNAGTYYFKVRAAAQIGSWEEPHILKIIILPPWWKSWWAYIAYIVLFLLLLYLLQQELEKRAALKHKFELEHYLHERDKDLSRQKLKFFTNLSHEFRTPLTLILGPLEKMIKNNEGSIRIHQKHVLIHKQAQKLLKLANQVMNFRKYESENLSLKAAEGNIIHFLNEVMIAFRNQARLKGIHFHFSSSNQEVKMWYDRDKIEIILSNLLSNAFKFTSSKGTVNLNVGLTTLNEITKVKEDTDKRKSVFYGTLPEGNEDYFQIEIHDTGCGIASDQLQHIFEHYYQATNLDLVTEEGSGIGLEITKNYVELHHGGIMVNSDLGIGTTFIVWLPLGNQHLQPEETIHNFKPSEHVDHYRIDPDKIEPDEAFERGLIDFSINGAKPEILLIDDNPDILSYLESNFEKHFNVVLASNGKEGLDKAREIIPDLIISDIMMPQMDGYELCAKIKSDVNTSHIPVILLTARISNVFRTEGLETGADDYITKPFDVHMLYLKVKNLIISRKTLREKYAREITLKPKEITINNSDEKFLNNLIAIIEEHITDDNFKVDDFARHLGMSHSGIYKKVKFLTNLSLVEFIRTIRLKKAKEYLLKTDLSISQVSFEVGFSDAKYFSKCFQKYFGKSPSQYVSDNKIEA